MLVFWEMYLAKKKRTVVPPGQLLFAFFQMDSKTNMRIFSSSESMVIECINWNKIKNRTVIALEAQRFAFFYQIYFLKD